jgi:RimJ/RimL family protein N-acetyltransferase
MTPNFPGPAYRIVTHRLVIRPWEPTDAPLLKAAVEESWDHLKPWMPWAAGDIEDLDAFIRRIRRWRGNFDQDHDYIYGIFASDGRQVRGSSGLHTRLGGDVREIGYWIHKKYINQGLATETAAALTKVAFEVDHIHRVEIHCDPENVRSAAVPAKLGFTHEVTRRQDTINSQGHRRDTMIWTLLVDEFPSSLSAKADIQAYDSIGRQII